MPNQSEIFRFCSQCQTASIVKQKHDLSNHKEISVDYLKSALQINVQCFSYKPFLDVQKILLKEMHDVRNRVTDLIKYMERNLVRLKLSSVMNIKDANLLTKMVAILSNDSEKVSEIKCCEMKDIVDEVEITMHSKKIGEMRIMRKLEELSQKITENLSDIVKQFDEKINLHQCSEDEEKVWKRAPKRNFWRKKDETLLDEFDGQNFRDRQNHQSNPQEYLRVQDLKNFPIQRIFHIRLKILKIVKRFEINGKQNIEFFAGDETGIAVCVVKYNPIIIPNNIISMTNCRIYIFKNKIKQIQTSSNSQVAILTDYQVGPICDNYNFTQDFPCNVGVKKKQPFIQKYKDQKASKKINFQDYLVDEDDDEEDDGYISGLPLKINLIKPGDKNLTFYAEVIEVRPINNFYICILGDNTGLVQVQVPNNYNFLKQGMTVKIIDGYAQIVNKKLKVCVDDKGKVTCIDNVKLKVNLYENFSLNQWRQIGMEEESQEEEIFEDM